MPSQRYLDLIEVNKQEHALYENSFTGQSLINLICHIGSLMQQMGCKSVLDYGCGKGVIQRHFDVGALWGVDYYPYDPGVPMFEKMPEGKFDAVVCTDVMEHIPEPDLSDWFIDDVFSRANKIVFVKVPTYLAEKILPNGENCHCTLHPKEWWETTLKAAAARHNVNVAMWIKTKGANDE